jgi:hypothetical protein
MSFTPQPRSSRRKARTVPADLAMHWHMKPGPNKRGIDAADRAADDRGNLRHSETIGKQGDDERVIVVVQDIVARAGRSHAAH